MIYSLLSQAVSSIAELNIPSNLIICLLLICIFSRDGLAMAKQVIIMSNFIWNLAFQSSQTDTDIPKIRHIEPIYRYDTDTGFIPILIQIYDTDITLKNPV